MITVKLNSKNDEVFILQKLLRKVGYMLTLDSDFGIKTDKAVRDFQFSHSLLADGIVGDKTWNILFSKAFKTGEDVLGTDLYQYDATTSTDFWEDLRNKYFFCFVKASEGATFNDPRFMEQFKKLEQYRILRGGYHFFRLMNEDVSGQITNFLDSGINFKAKGVLPPVLDIEPSNEEWKNVSTLTNNRVAIVRRIKKWLTEVEKKTGKKPIIYTSKQIWDNILKAPAGFSQYPLWLANYTDGLKRPPLPTGWTDYAFWQYTDEGVIGGKGGFDVNKLNLPYADLLDLAGF